MGPAAFIMLGASSAVFSSSALANNNETPVAASASEDAVQEPVTQREYCRELDSRRKCRRAFEIEAMFQTFDASGVSLIGNHPLGNLILAVSSIKSLKNDDVEQHFLERLQNLAGKGSVSLAENLAYAFREDKPYIFTEADMRAIGLDPTTTTAVILMPNQTRDLINEARNNMQLPVSEDEVVLDGSVEAIQSPSQNVVPR